MLVCVFLWLVVDVLKTMAAKLMANHFHQETYFQRMQEALRKVLALLPFLADQLSLAVYGLTTDSCRKSACVAHV